MDSCCFLRNYYYSLFITSLFSIFRAINFYYELIYFKFKNNLSQEYLLDLT